jgi:hypothetical protein
MNSNPISYPEGSWFKTLLGERPSCLNISPISSVFKPNPRMLSQIGLK